jgi:hypothetical protein
MYIKSLRKDSWQVTKSAERALMNDRYCIRVQQTNFCELKNLK